MSFKKITVRSSETGERLDTFLAKKSGITRSQIKKLIEKGDVLVNGKCVSQSYKIRKEDVISVNTVEKKNEGLIAEPIPIEILYKDDYVVVVNKPPSMVVYPAAGHARGTLMNALTYYCKKLATAGAPLRPGVVHRLDKDTSGVMVVALEDKAYYDLIQLFRQRNINRKYIALIYGYPGKDEGEITSMIGRSVSDRKKMSTCVKRGKEAITKWKVLKRFVDATLIEVRLETGRTHQIRVHFASIGHPVLGDKTYGKKVELKGKKNLIFPRQMLHAALLGFTHPATGEYLEFSSPLPDDMMRKIQELIVLFK
ncbi:MAG: RluA family pseudouridine synthase [Nitrospirae bacterium]|jgi:23S rRNA pseudouridine1911/1915/1917 synthase|nr:RluA family pseudouridine synthase [Nitrospirota bacterium]